MSVAEAKASPKLLIDCTCSVGESPVWDAARNRLWWVDVGSDMLWWTDLELRTPIAIALEISPSFVALTASGGVCLAAGRGWYDLDHETGNLTELVRPGTTPSPDWRMNDGVVDQVGRIWTGTIGLPRSDTSRGALFRLGADGVALMADDLMTQNGLAISPDGTTLYLADSHPSRALIWAYDLEMGTGAISNKRVFHTCTGGRPDGAAMDVEGGYWFALIDGGEIQRIAADGHVTHRISMPVSRPTNICFGGPDMQQLFITSMRAGLSDDVLDGQPMAGSILTCPVPLAGEPVPMAG